MPGRYREPDSRKAPLNDPKCADLTQQDSSGALTPSYRYQVTCPNDQNLVYVQGRKVPKEPAPSPPLADRHGIPDEGPCVRCNFQIEGSGPSPDDVLIDGGSDYDGKGIEAKPGGCAKHVVLRVDRADGFVARNLLVRGALEHGIYIEEADGYRLERVKFFWAADYGNLTFTSDHGLYKNCDGFGSGDSVVYPGAAPETGSQATGLLSRRAAVQHRGQEVRHARLGARLLGLDGQRGADHEEQHLRQRLRAVDRHDLGRRAPRASRPTASQIDHNLIYSNNLNLFVDDPPVEPVVGVPVGVGVLWPGHNDGRVHDNWIFDNWRRGTMLLAIPDAIVGLTPEGSVDPGVSCPTAPSVTTSCNNHYYDNHMGQAPPDFKKRAWNGLPLRRPRTATSPIARCPTGSTSGGTSGRATPATAGSTTPAPTAPRRASPARAPARRPRSCRRTAPRRTAAATRRRRGPARLLDVGARPDGRRPPDLRLVLEPARARDRRRQARAERRHGARAGRTSCATAEAQRLQRAASPTTRAPTRDRRPRRARAEPVEPGAGRARR